MAFLLCLRLFVFLVVTGGRLAVLPEPSLSLEDEWTAFKVEFNKTYPSQAEHDRRKLILLETLAVIKKHNAEYNLSDPNAPHFKMGLNEFSDWSEEEFASMYGDLPSTNFTPTLHESPEYIPRCLEAYPKELDLRKKSYVTGVKHQGEPKRYDWLWQEKPACGSCYAFAAVGALEGQIARKTGQLISLSAQNLVDCSKGSVFGNSGCNGGNPDSSFEYIRDRGIATEKDYPYENQEGSCQYKKKGNLADVIGYNKVYGECDLVKALNDVGPLYVSFASSPTFLKHKSGVYGLFCPYNAKTNHAMLLIGYGWENGERYWLVKNSWGETWGERGYGKILRGEYLCSIDNRGAYPLLSID